jgi:hypothetical protein
MKELIIDSHVQVGTGESWSEPRRPVEYRVDFVLERAAQAGINRSCIAAPLNTSYKEPNREVARVVERYPDRLMGFAVHSPQRETGRLRDMLVEEVNHMGLKGVKSDGHPTRELLDIVAELGVPIIYYPDTIGCANLVEVYYTMALMYPGVNFILPHLGSYRSDEWSAHIQAIDLMKRFPNLYAETSSIVNPKYLEQAARELPAGKLIFGSFSPELDCRVELFAITMLDLAEQERSKILGGNIKRLLHL